MEKLRKKKKNMLEIVPPDSDVQSLSQAATTISSTVNTSQMRQDAVTWTCRRLQPSLGHRAISSSESPQHGGKA